jgi:hypothetical protein
MYIYMYWYIYICMHACIYIYTYLELNGGHICWHTLTYADVCWRMRIYIYVPGAERGPHRQWIHEATAASSPSPGPVCIRQHTSAYVSIRQRWINGATAASCPSPGPVCIRQDTSGYVRIRQDTSGYVSDELTERTLRPLHLACKKHTFWTIITWTAEAARPTARSTCL